MKRLFFKPFICILFAFVSFSVFAQNAIPRSLVEKINFLQDVLQLGDEKKFADELQYIDIIKNHYLDHYPEAQEELIKNDEERIKELFAYIQFDPESNTFKESCFEDKNENSLTKKCVSPSWDGKILSISLAAESVDLVNPNGEDFEFGGMFFFEFDSQRNKLTLINYGLAG
jgi:hypothetical protein